MLILIKRSSPEKDTFVLSSAVASIEIVLQPSAAGDEYWLVLGGNSQRQWFVDKKAKADLQSLLDSRKKLVDGLVNPASTIIEVPGSDSPI